MLGRLDIEPIDRMWGAMSLRLRLIGLVALALVLSLSLGGIAACFNASRLVRTEMRSALLVGRQMVENAVAELSNSRDPQRDLEKLIASFKGDRHLRISLTGDAQASTVPPGDQSPFGVVPAWFVELIGVAPTADRVPIVLGGHSYGSVVIETDPHNEILERWSEFGESLVLLSLFCGGTVLLIFLFIGHALRPLDRLASAMERVGRGDYGTRIEGNPAPELNRLTDSFNHMVAELVRIDADNRRLNEQLLTLEARERRELANDLHDEVSPFLFAINVDLANASRLLKEGRVAELPDYVQSIGDAVRHMQRQVRSMLGRLRPAGLAEFGLADAIGSLVEFWRRRHPAIDYRVSIAPGCEGLGELAETTIYRIVQESLSNAVRHGKAGTIAIAIGRAGASGVDELTVEVADDGQGLTESSSPGYGLLGMRERVRASGGRLTIANRPGGGVAVTAALPRTPRPNADAAALEAAEP
jgi:two-component system sensor histidine kinase UhpB